MAGDGGARDDTRRRRRANIVGVVIGAFLVIGVGVGRMGGTLPLGGEGGERASCDDPLAWDEVSVELTGDEVAVEGPVAAATTEPEVGGAPTFVNLGNPYPDQPRFDVVIYEDVRAGLDDDPEEALPGEVVCAAGELDVRDGVPQIVVPSPVSLVVR